MTRAELLATLVVDGALRMIDGTVQGKSPVEPVVLTPEEGAKAGVETGELGLFHPIEDDGVFMSMGADKATVWFNGGDCTKALDVLEAALQRAYPAARRLEDTPNARDVSMRSRTYEVPMSGGRIGLLDVAYPQSGASRRQFAVRVFSKIQRAN